MVSLLNSNVTIGKCISEKVYDKKTITPYFDCDLDAHSSDKNEINNTLKHSQNTVRDLFRPICAYKIIITVSSVHKSAKQGYKLSVHCVVWNVQIIIDGLYDLIHDNIELLELLHFDCKEDENLECLLTLVTYILMI